MSNNAVSNQELSRIMQFQIKN